MAYKRKTRDVWYIMTNCGYGWECESEYSDIDYEHPRREAFRGAQGYQEVYGISGVKVEKHRERI